MKTIKNIPVKLIEDHDEAYYFWKKLGLLNRPLVHLDAHIDFNFHPASTIKQAFSEARSKEALIRELSTTLMNLKLKIKEKELTNIGNYIYPAMREGMVSDFYWVIPGDRKEFNRSKKAAISIIKSFFSRDPRETKNIRIGNGVIKAEVYGRNFFVTTMDDLPKGLKGAFLDIDTDYLTTDTIRKAGAGTDAGRRFPWIFPDELFDRIKDKIAPSCVTVAYSVNGGFTPIIYKFLGDEVGAFFSGKTGGLDVFMPHSKLAFKALHEGNSRRTIENIERSLCAAGEAKVDPRLMKKLRAHANFILFRAYSAVKDAGGAGRSYSKSVKLDKSYRVRDNNYGPLHLMNRKKLKAAEKEFSMIVSADPDNRHALAGMGDVFMAKRDFKKARSFFKRALKTKPNDAHILFSLARAELSLKDYRAALKYLGACKNNRRLRASGHSVAATIYRKLGMIDKALAEYRIAHSLGADFGLYLDLFGMLKRTGVPQAHREWINNAVDSYKRQKEAFLKLPRRSLKKPHRIARAQTIKMLDKIDRKIGERF